MEKRLNTFTIFKETSGFIWRKVGISLLSMLILVVPALILFGIGMIFNAGVGVILGIIGLVVGNLLRKLFNKYFGYMVKAAHVAVITEAVQTGAVPSNQFEYGKNVVKANFAETNIYFVIDTLVSKAVAQIQAKMSGVSDLVGNLIPMGGSFINQFIKAALDYIDECCLGYTFYRKDESNKFKSSCDGIVLYFQNWKDLLKSCLKASAIAVASTLVITLAITLFLGLLLNIFLSGTTAFVVALMIGLVVSGVIKSAFVDTYVYIEIMNSFMPYAVSQAPQLDLYNKFCKISSSFRELFNKACGSQSNSVSQPQQRQ